MSKVDSTAIEAVLDMAKVGIRSESLIPFHREDICLPFSAGFRAQIGWDKKGDDRIRKIVTEAAGIAEVACPGLKLSVRDNLYALILNVAGNAEWADVLRYAHGTGEQAAVTQLSPAGAALLERVESGELTGEFRSELSVRHRIRYFGYGANFRELLQEVRVKRGIEIELLEKGETWSQRQHFVRFKVLSRSDPNSRTGLRISAQPVLVLPGWYVVLKAVGPITVVNHKQIAGTINRSGQRLLTDEQIDLIARQLDDRCRDVEQ